MTDPGISWEIERLAPQATVVHLCGNLDEHADLDRLLVALEAAPEVRFNMSEVHRINSVGVREWVNFVATFSKQHVFSLEQCSPSVVAQLNMIFNFAGGASVTSVFAPYVCDSCGHEKRILFETTSAVDLQSAPMEHCPTCGEEMVLDDLPEAYFAFQSLTG